MLEIDKPLRAFGIKVIRRLREGAYGERILIGLRRDLAVPFSAPFPRVPIHLREFRLEDTSTLFPSTDGVEAERECKDVMWRLRSVEEGLLRSRCYVAVDETSDRPCHIQWLTEGYNDAIRIAAALPTLSNDEALLENAYTARAYRGMGIMAAVTGQIVELAEARGVRFVVAFIDHRNIASLRGGQRAGLSPWRIAIQRQYGFGLVRRARFEATHADFRL
ncbi:GNAT family N-acetyltransferase [Methylobacterium sp. DCY52]|uniref:GNAT family N-acetyltransferase n=1 Tax=Methylobacterium sp. DCY52 TaxID=739139 RepID=UPI0031456643